MSGFSQGEVKGRAALQRMRSLINTEKSSKECIRIRHDQWLHGGSAYGSRKKSVEKADDLPFKVPDAENFNSELRFKRHAFR